VATDTYDEVAPDAAPRQDRGGGEELQKLPATAEEEQLHRRGRRPIAGAGYHRSSGARSTQTKSTTDQCGREERSKKRRGGHRRLREGGIEGYCFSEDTYLPRGGRGPSLTGRRVIYFVYKAGRQVPPPRHPGRRSGRPPPKEEAVPHRECNCESCRARRRVTMPPRPKPAPRLTWAEKALARQGVAPGWSRVGP
jgi:hypothetical protein